MIKKIENLFANVTIVFCIIVIISILLLNINTFYWADDFCFINSVRQSGILQHCINGYFDWDGRFLSVASFIQAFLLTNVQIEFITLFWNLCFLVSGYLIFIIVKNQLDLKITSKYKIICGLTTAIFIWYGSKVFLAQTVYWGTGGAYSASLIIGMLWIVQYQKSQKSDLNLQNKILLLIFTFIAGATTQNFSIGFVTLILFDLLIDLLNKDFKQFKFKLLVLCFSISGILMLLLAPGNSLRMKEIDGLEIGSLTLNDYINNFYDVLIIYYHACKELIFMSVISGIVFRTFCYDGFINIFKIKFKIVNKKNFVINLLQNFKWIFVALSTIMPFIFMPMMAAERTILYFAFFSVIAIYVIVLRNYKIQEFKFHYKKLIAFTIIIFIVGSSSNFALKNMKKGFIVKQEMIKREKMLLNSANQDVTIEVISKDLLSPCYQFFDLQENLPQDHFNILGHREYYNLKKITVIDRN